jgi:hypothetical protein
MVYKKVDDSIFTNKRGNQRPIRSDDHIKEDVQKNARDT